MQHDDVPLDRSAWPDLEGKSLQERVDSVGTWYHTIELPGGIVTDGVYDMRPYVDAYELPDLNGLEVLDVGASNGFFSFLFESRGARVTAVDLPSYRTHDFPAWILKRELQKRSDAELSKIDWDELHGGFLTAHEALGSSVDRVLTRIYEMAKATDKRFDLVFCSNVLVHLRDPVLALEAIREMAKPGGRVVVATPMLETDFGDASAARFIGHGDGPAFWVPAPRTFVHWCQIIGLHDAELIGTYDCHRRGGIGGSDHVGVVHATR